MTDQKGIALALEDWKILFQDDWKSLIIALYMVLVGYGVLVGYLLSVQLGLQNWVLQKLRWVELPEWIWVGLPQDQFLLHGSFKKLIEEYWPSLESLLQ